MTEMIEVESFLVVMFISKAIRVACKWYQEHLGTSCKTVLVTNDRYNFIHSILNCCKRSDRKGSKRRACSHNK